MIITEPNAIVAEVHDRKPVVLEPDQFTPWLENEAGLEILRPAGEGVLDISGLLRGPEQHWRSDWPHGRRSRNRQRAQSHANKWIGTTAVTPTGLATSRAPRSGS